MTVNLYADKSALIRAAFTAMDQSYGNVQVNDVLHPIDNQNLQTPSSTREQPFQVPGNFVVKAVIDDPNGFGGKFVIYKDTFANTMLVTAMGTNGNGDAMGWYTNFSSYGVDQWREGQASTAVYLAMASAGVNAETKIVFNGDSKGGMLAQIIAYDFVTERNKIGSIDSNSKFELSALSTLASVNNDHIAIVAHSSAGISDYLRRTLGDEFDQTWADFQGVAVDYSAFRDFRTGLTDAVTMIGGDTLNGFGAINGVGIALNFATDADQRACSEYETWPNQFSESSSSVGTGDEMARSPAACLHR